MDTRWLALEGTSLSELERRMKMAEVFEEGVVIADVVTDEKDINQEALDHLNEMGKGDEE